MMESGSNLFKLKLSKNVNSKSCSPNPIFWKENLNLNIFVTFAFLHFKICLNSYETWSLFGKNHPNFVNPKLMDGLQPQSWYLVFTNLLVSLVSHWKERGHPNFPKNWWLRRPLRDLDGHGRGKDLHNIWQRQICFHGCKIQLE